MPPSRELVVATVMLTCRPLYSKPSQLIARIVGDVITPLHMLFFSITKYSNKNEYALPEAVLADRLHTGYQLISHNDLARALQATYESLGRTSPYNVLAVHHQSVLVINDMVGRLTVGALLSYRIPITLTR